MRIYEPTKERVESCLTIGPPRGPLRDSEGVWYWHEYGWVVQYSVSATDSTLHLAFNHGQAVHQYIQLDSTEPNFGGVRWWFLCPKCNGRVSHLHRPSHTYYFFCRHCYDLSYESAQSSRKKSEKFFQALARDLDSTTRQARSWLRVTHPGGAVHEVKRPILNKVRDRRTGIALMITKQARGRGLMV
jgi:hypothetical protein